MPSFTIIEPMSTGDVIDRAVRLYRRNFAPLIAVMSVPTLVGYLSSMMFWFGYTKLLLSVEPGGGASVDVPAYAYLLMALGGAGYPVWMLTSLMSIAGITRVIGDQIMLGEPVTFRSCVKAVRQRIGDIVLMGLLFLVILVVLYIAFTIIAFALILVVGAMAGLTAAARLPSWMVGIMLGIAIVITVGLAIVAFLYLIVRFIFLPQVVMIEGQSAGSALGRAIRLGQGNWHRFGAIILFIQFISLSLLAALQLPFMATLYFLGIALDDLILNPAWNAVYTGFNQISSLLVWPILIVALTLLYFDSRVRKEAYDLELLAREISPGFYWQPSVMPATFSYQPPVASPENRSYVQTSPLGLAGYWPPVPAMTEVSPASESNAAQGNATQENVAREYVTQEYAAQEDGAASHDLACKSCGATIEQGHRFCMLCGSAVS